MKVVIMRGIPGSGKSTWVKENYPKAIVCSADDYFLHYNREIGKVDEYRFDPSKLGEAHKECMLNFIHNVVKNKEMFKQGTVIVVDNTNIAIHEVTPYLRVAQAYDWSVEVVRVECDPIKANERNIHSVPWRSIKRMHRNLRPLPEFFGKEIVVRTE